MTTLRPLAAALLLLASSLALLPVAEGQLPAGDNFQDCMQDQAVALKTDCLSGLVADLTSDCGDQVNVAGGCMDVSLDAVTNDGCDALNAAQAPADPLFGLLCTVVRTLPGVTVTDITRDGPDPDTTPDHAADEDSDGRPDIYKVTIAPGAPAPTTSVYLQTDFFYTPAGATPPYQPTASDFDYAVTGVMLYNPQSGVLQQSNQAHRFTDHYQGIDGWYAVYVFDNAAHYGAATVAIAPASATIDMAEQAKLHLDVDRTPFLGTGCDGHTKFAGADLQAGQCDNSIDEGDGGGHHNADAILLQLPGQKVTGTEFLFYDGLGLRLDDLHIKYGTDDPDGSAPLLVDYAAYSNLDNDANTDFEELTCPSGEITNPTNAKTSCDDVDGDGIPRSVDTDDRHPDPPMELFLTATKADGTAIPAATPYAVAPLEVDLAYRCKLNVGTVTGLTIDFGTQYNGITTGTATSIALPLSHCDNATHHVKDADVSGKNPVYVFLGGDVPDYTFTPKLTATHGSGTSVVPDTESFKLTGTPVALGFTFVGNRAYAPVDFTGSSASCTSPAGHAFVPTGSKVSFTDAVSGDANSGDVALQCSAAGATTSFGPTLYHSGSARKAIATANFDGANSITVTKTMPVDNLAETGTLAATCASTCYSNAPSIAWTLAPTSLGDEAGQGWESVMLYKGATPTYVGDMVFNAASGQYEYVETGRAAQTTYQVRILDAGHLQTTLSKTLGAEPTPNAAPTVDELKLNSQAVKPKETGYVLNTADPSQSKVTTQFFASATDQGSQGHSGTSDPSTVVVQFLTATTLDGASAPVPPAAALAKVPTCPSQKSPSTQVPGLKCPADLADGNSTNGEAFQGSTALSPLLSYTYRFKATDSDGAFGYSNVFTLKAAINKDSPADTPAGDAIARPLSFAFLVAGGAAVAVQDQVAGVQAAVEDVCGRPVSGPADAQPCAEKVVYEDICGLPAPHSPAQLPDCKNGQSQVAALVALVYGVVETLACEEHSLTGDCVAWRVQDAQDRVGDERDAAIRFIEGTVCPAAEVLCADDQSIPVPNPVAVLTRQGGCNVLSPQEWAARVPSDGADWNDSCNAATIQDPTATVTDLLELLLGDGVPEVPLPFGDASSHNQPNDAGTDTGSSEQPNGQLDVVESRVLGYRFDGSQQDPRDPFDAGNELGVTFFVGNPSQQQVANPRHGLIVRVGDVAGTPMQEILVVEDLRNPAAPTVTCVGIEPSPGTVDSVYVRQGAHRFRADGDAPTAACGPVTRSTAVRYDVLADPASGTIGLMVWEDRDANGRRVDGDDADASLAGLASEDILGFRLHASPTTQPSLRLDVNQGSQVTSVQDDGLTARIQVPDAFVGPVQPGAALPLIVVGSSDLHVDADVYSRSGTGAWAPYAGHVTLYLQRDCERAPAVGDETGLCYAGGDMAPYTLAVDGTLVSPGHYAFTLRAGQVRDRLFYTDSDLGLVPATLLHAWVQSGARTSNYAAPGQALFDLPAAPTATQPADPVLTAADLVDDVWTPVAAVLDCQPNPTADDPTADSDADGTMDGCDTVDDKDTDQDGIGDPSDNCPSNANADQANRDGDAQGDACDGDDDNDGKADGADACPVGKTGWTSSASTDIDGDGCRDSDEDSDDDGDGFADATDKCPKVSDDQTDTDGDGIGDACEPADTDSDGVADTADNCPAISNADQANYDGDATGDACDANDDNDSKADDVDACPKGQKSWTSTATTDHDGDGCRDSDEDSDDDNDGVPDVAANPADSDNCPYVANADQADSDGNGVGDACQAPDQDHDGVDDATDNCVSVANANQLDTDDDNAGDACDSDDDGDGVADASDRCPKEGIPQAGPSSTLPLSTVLAPVMGPVLHGCADQRGVLAGDALVADIRLPGAPLPALLIDGADQAITVLVRESGTAATTGSYTLYVQVDCGALQPATAVVPVQCSGGAVTSVKSIAKMFSATGSAVSIPVTDAELQSLLQAPLPATAVHVWVQAADGRQSNFALPTQALITAGQIDAADLIDAQAWHPVPVAGAGPAPTPCTPPSLGVDGDCQSAPAPCTPPQVGVDGDCQSAPAPCTPPQVGVDGDCQDVVPSGCADGQVGVTDPLCVDEPGPCADGQIGPMAPACFSPPEQLACLQADPTACLEAALGLVGETLCAVAGEGAFPQCLAGAPAAVLDAACGTLTVCDSDADGVPDPVDQCAGADDADPSACPAPDGGQAVDDNAGCEGHQVSFGVGYVCVIREGGSLTGQHGLRGIRIRVPGFTINL